MNARAALLTDGTSDVPVGQHVARLARRYGCEMDVVAPDLSRLPDPPGRQVASRLEALFEFDDAFDLAIVHRDAEADDPGVRYAEITDGVAAAREGLPCLPVVPVRMTEAWLLVDEAAIRLAAGRPEGRDSLNLPPPGEVEAIPDPKRILQAALIRASGAKGRRLKAFKRDFGSQRRRLLEWLDHSGPVSGLAAWKGLERSVEQAVGQLASG